MGSLFCFKRTRSSMAKKSKHVEEEESSADQTMEIESPTKIKKEKDDGKAAYDELLNHVSIIAQPMASRKLTKKVYKLLKKGNFNLLL